jgi:hypothetical protein
VTGGNKCGLGKNVALGTSGQLGQLGVGGGGGRGVNYGVRRGESYFFNVMRFSFATFPTHSSSFRHLFSLKHLFRSIAHFLNLLGINQYAQLFYISSSGSSQLGRCHQQDLSCNFLGE